MMDLPYFQAFLALIVVLSLMGLLKLALMRLERGGALKSLMTAATSPRRLQIIEMMPLGLQHRAILLRVDGTEHLVIIGPNGQTELRHTQKNPEQMT